jgi:putative ABC transport system permease protein
MARGISPYAARADERSVVAWAIDGAATRAVLGVPLLAGRDLEPSDAHAVPTPILLDADLAAALFPGAPALALGRQIELRERQPFVVVGVTAPFRPISGFAPFSRQVLVFPDEEPLLRAQSYVVRAVPGGLERAMAAARARLTALAPARAVEVRSLAELRTTMDRSGRGGIAIFGFMVVVVILVVLSGTFGMVSFLVTERTKQIGMRRALGATRHDILKFFLLENWLLTTLGIVFGLPLTYGLNVLARLAQPDLDLDWQALALGVVLFWVAADLAAFLPALRAASIPPTVATKTV